MRLTVFGASGATGRRLVEQALGAGHHVTAVTRRPERIPPRDGLRALGADVADTGAVDAAIAGSDAVLSALGVSYSASRSACTPRAPATSSRPCPGTG
jgi:putative NADH-flavin reductase